MSTVFSSFSTSLDGFVARPDDDVGPLFEWYGNGDVEIRPPGYPMTLRLSKASAKYWRETSEDEGAFITGRRLFDYAHGWGGQPPLGVPTFVVSHRPPPADWPPRQDGSFTFVSDGIEAALELATKAAGGRDINVGGPNLAQQFLNAGLLDEVRIDLVPVLFGEGIRYFDNITNKSVQFADPQVTQGKRVTHLRYRVTYD